MPMQPKERKAALVLRGIKQSEIAKTAKLSQAYVSDVIAGNRRSAAIEELIAKAIEKPVDEVFPPRVAA